MRVGELYEYQGRVMKVSELFGSGPKVYYVVAECLTPKDEDKGKKWWTIDIAEPMQKITRH